MLNKKFNKIGGTEIRTKHQVDFYIMLCEWIKKVQKDEKEAPKTSGEWDKEFKEWTKEEQIYSYKNDKKIDNRFKFIVSSLNKIGIYKNGFKFIIPNPINRHVIFQSLFSYQNKHIKNKAIYPFLEMIKFVFANPEKNNAKQIILSFLVYDGKESFLNLYSKDIISELAKSVAQEMPKFEKPTNVNKFIQTIFIKKENGLQINFEDFKGYDHQKDNYIKKIVLEYKEKYDLQKMISRLNRLDFKTFIYKFYHNKFSQTLKKDYLDLFSRWLYDFGLVDTSGKKVETFYNYKIKKEKDTYYIQKEEPNDYPWNSKEVDGFIKQIASGNFNFKYQSDDLKQVTNSTIAEYFVNLYYAYKLKIAPHKFCEFVNTKVSDQLKPIFTAPGGKPDMSFSSQKILVNVETTIIKNKNQVQNNEIFPCTRHYTKIASQSKASSQYLIFVSPLDPIDIEKYFNLVFQNDNPQGNLIICQFNDLQFPNLENF